MKHGTYGEGWDAAVAEMRADHWTRETARRYTASVGKANGEFGRGVLLIGIAEQRA